MKHYILISIFFVLLCSCGIPQSEYDKIKSEKDSLEVVVKSLKNEIDLLKNGEERIVNLAKNSYQSKEYAKTKLYIEDLLLKHPESSKISYFKKILSEIQPKIKVELAKIEKQKKDSIRLANINELGIWETGFYIDEFDEPTKEAYIKTEIRGKFSNSATTNSDLNVKFLISKNSIRIQLYEYAGNHPIKGDGFPVITIKDSNGKVHTVRSYNSQHGDNTIEPEHFDEMKNILLNGGRIKFIAISGSSGSPSEYKFEIENADYFENAMLKAFGNTKE